jgi:hypothetical protein
MEYCCPGENIFGELSLAETEDSHTQREQRFWVLAIGGWG